MLACIECWILTWAEFGILEPRNDELFLITYIITIRRVFTANNAKVGTLVTVHTMIREHRIIVKCSDQNRSNSPESG